MEIDMGFFDFVKGIGKKNNAKPVEQPSAPAASEPSAQETANKLLGLVKGLDLGITGLAIGYNSTSDLATIKGEAPSQAAREKAILVVGNVDHVARVDDQMTVATAEPESKL